MNPICISARTLGRGGWTAGLVLLAWVAGRAGQVAEPEPAIPPVETAADAAYWPPERGPELLAVDEPMRAFFAARVKSRDPDSERLRQIAAAILAPEGAGLGFVYDPAGTYDAREVFRRRRGNCQGFAFLMVAMGREHGLKVSFQDIVTYQRWNRFDRFIATVRHTNVRMTSAQGEDFVVDLRPELGRPSFDNERFIVKDERAFAHFYSTAGFFRLVRGDRAGALRLMEHGTEVDPRSPIVWTNLGNLRAQLGDLAAARACFEQALRLDSRMDDALVGLVGVLRQGGPAEQKLAERYERRAQAYRDRNPYYVYQMGCEARARQDWAEAEKCLRRSIRLKRDEPLFHEEFVALLRETGREQEARRAEARLAKLRAKLTRAETYVVP